MTDNFIMIGNLESEKIEQLISNIKEEGNSSNLIITDINSAIKKETEYDLKRKGYDVQTIDIAGLKAENYNPFEYLDADSDIELFANDFVDSQAQESQDLFWVASEKAVFAGMLMYMARTNRPKTLTEVENINGELYKDVRYLEEIIKYSSKSVASTLQTIKREDVLKSVCLSLRIHLEAEGKFGESNSYNLREFNKKKTVLFIELSDKDVTSNWIAKCIISQLVRLQIKDKENNEPVKNVLIVLNDVILDDFIKSGETVNLAAYMTAGRKYNMAFCLYLKSTNQLTDRYKDTVYIMENIGAMYEDNTMKKIR